MLVGLLANICLLFKFGADPGKNVVLQMRSMRQNLRDEELFDLLSGYSAFTVR
ncbi:hypothetical protein Ptc2401_00990 [Prosthecochloris sp. CIB 2401]|nr:hypothetical protein Ptc2401_00990 [Prosthecochloris sp. CIB 2401]